MKKTLVAVLLLAGLVAGSQSAFAVATTVDFDAHFTFLAGYFEEYAPTTADLERDTWEADETGNGMLDTDELAALSAVLANEAHPAHAVVYAVWNGVRNHVAWTTLEATIAAHPLYGPLGAAVPIVDSIVGYCVLGGERKNNHAIHVLESLGVAYEDAAAMVGATPTTVNGILGETANPDGDYMDNSEEYAAIAGTGGPASAKRASYITNIFTVDEPPALEVAITGGGSRQEGTAVTLTAVTTYGTEPFTYAWTKDGVPTGGNSASIVIAAAAVADSGDYAVTVTDSSDPVQTASATATLTVVAGLPAMGVAGLALLVALCAGAGVVGVRKSLKK